MNHNINLIFFQEEVLGLAINRIAIIIDDPNFRFCTGKLGVRFNFIEFITQLERTQNSEVTIKRIYFDDNTVNSIENSYYGAMKKSGFEARIVPKKIFHRKGQENGRIDKSRTDAWILVEVTELLVHDEFDTLVLFSGDSDYEPLLQTVCNYGKKNIIVGARHNLAEDLIDYGDIILLEDWMDTTLVYPAQIGFGTKTGT